MEKKSTPKNHKHVVHKKHPNYVPKIFLDKRGSLVTFPPIHKIDGVFAVRLRYNV